MKSSSSVEHKSTLRIALFLLVIERILLWVAYSGTPIPNGPISDSWIYFNLAKAWVGTGTMPSEALFHPPLYPYLLGVVFRIFPITPISMIFVQNVLGIASSLLILRWVQRWSKNEEPFWFALLLLLFSAPLISFEWKLHDVTFVAAAEILFLEFVWRLTQKKGNLLLTISLSLLASFLTLLRPNFILIWPLFWIWGWRAKTLTVRSTLISASIVILALTPILIRNAEWGAGFTLSANSGLTFAQGNNPHSAGAYSEVPGVNSDVSLQNLDALEHGGTVSAANRFWWNEGLTYLANHPLKALELYLRKFILFLSPQEKGGDFPYGFERRKIPLLYFLSGANFTLLLLLAIPFWKRRNETDFPWEMSLGLFGISFVTCLIFFVINRYRLPAWPLLVFPASQAWEHRRSLPLLMGAALVMGWGLLSPVNLSAYRMGWHNWGVAYEHSGDAMRAIQAYRQVLFLDPHHRPTMENLGRAYLQTNELDQAYFVLQKLVTQYPDSYFGHNNLSVYYLQKGEWAKAASEAEVALHLRPSEAAAQKNLVLARQKLTAANALQ